MSSSITIASTGSAAILNISPWVTFDNIWTSLKDYPAESFEFVPGKTPMATGTESLLAISLYYLIIFAGREVMKKRTAFSLNALFMAHNFILSIGSGALLVLFVEQMAPTWWKNGLYYCICGAGGWTNKLVTLYYVRSCR
jgi:fatty acid elongase 3